MKCPEKTGFGEQTGKVSYLEGIPRQHTGQVDGSPALASQAPGQTLVQSAEKSRVNPWPEYSPRTFAGPCSNSRGGKLSSGNGGRGWLMDNAMNLRPSQTDSAPWTRMGRHILLQVFPRHPPPPHCRPDCLLLTPIAGSSFSGAMLKLWPRPPHHISLTPSGDRAVKEGTCGQGCSSPWGTG